MAPGSLLPPDPQRGIIYAGIGGLLLKFLDMLLGRIGTKRRQSMSELRLVVDANAQLLEEKDHRIEELHAERDEAREHARTAEDEIRRFEAKVRVMESGTRSLKQALEDAEVELKLWRTGRRSPHPPSQDKAS